MNKSSLLAIVFTPLLLFFTHAFAQNTSITFSCAQQIACDKISDQCLGTAQVNQQSIGISAQDTIGAIGGVNFSSIGLDSHPGSTVIVHCRYGNNQIFSQIYLLDSELGCDPWNCKASQNTISCLCNPA